MTYNLFLRSCQGFIKYPNSVYSATKACLKVKKKKIGIPVFLIWYLMQSILVDMSVFTN